VADWCATSPDEVLSFDDVELPEGRLCDELQAEQHFRFDSTVSGAAL
jgi:hypothetical protein